MASQAEWLKWVPQTRFMVDGFNFQNPACQHYFLTHCHSDHTTGLTRSFTSGHIFCSPVSARLLVEEQGIAAARIRPMAVGRSYDVDGVRVTPIDANHCPGAVLFLFQVPRRPRATPAHGQRACPPADAMQAVLRAGGGGSVPPPLWQSTRGDDDGDAFFNVLHTGDFRWTRRMAAPPLLGLRVDVLMLDTTYAGPKHVFPGQEETVDSIVRLMREEEAANPGETLFVVGSYHIGKERAYLGAARALGWRVYCSANKRRTLSRLDLGPDLDRILTEDPREARIHVDWMGQIRAPLLKSRMEAGGYKAVVGVRPTGWSFRPNAVGPSRSRSYNGRVVVYGVPYSEHSSWPELRDCIATLKPLKIIPTVGARTQADARRVVERFAGLPGVPENKASLAAFGFTKVGAGGKTGERPVARRAASPVRNVAGCAEDGKGGGVDLTSIDVGEQVAILAEIQRAARDDAGGGALRKRARVEDGAGAGASVGRGRAGIAAYFKRV
ncbi:unnamed protein product [Pedinophyceae sp. YPF-701]|nr:unnamed protein product [Pedinophyceae sp. YPF-701]